VLQQLLGIAPLLLLLLNYLKMVFLYLLAVLLVLLQMWAFSFEEHLLLTMTGLRPHCCCCWGWSQRDLKDLVQRFVVTLVTLVCLVTVLLPSRSTVAAGYDHWHLPHAAPTLHESMTATCDAGLNSTYFYTKAKHLHPKC
jgi:hypothetical protein